MDQEVTIESDGFLIIVLQHEIDHLKGKLFIDYLSPLKQKVALKKVKNACRN
jgi:peptide deformylase